MNGETDFVGRSEKFKELVDDLAMQVAFWSTGSVCHEGNLSLLEKPFIKDDSVSVKNLVRRSIAGICETIKLWRFPDHRPISEFLQKISNC